jgi:hypothetical protein
MRRKEKAKMDFEPTYSYLTSVLSLGNDEEASKLLDGVILSSGVPKLEKYEINDFIKLCEGLGREGGRIKIISMSSIAQARCYRALKIMEERKKERSLIL